MCKYERFIFLPVLSCLDTETLLKLNFAVLRGLVLSALCVLVFRLDFVSDRMPFPADCHSLEVRFTCLEHLVSASMVEFCLCFNFLDCDL